MTQDMTATPVLYWLNTSLAQLLLFISCLISLCEGPSSKSADCCRDVFTLGWRSQKLWTDEGRWWIAKFFLKEASSVGSSCYQPDKNVLWCDICQNKWETTTRMNENNRQQKQEIFESTNCVTT